MRPPFIKPLTLLVIAAFAVFGSPAASSAADGLVGESSYFKFYSDPRINLHHFLYNYALRRNEGQEDTAYLDIVGKLTPDEAQAFQAALDFYADNLVEQDLRTGEKNYSVKQRIVEQPAGKDLTPVPEVPGYADAINPFIPVYEKHFWPGHHDANKRVLEENIALIEAIEKDAAEKLCALAKANWQTDKIRVDISYHSKRERPYTTTRPTTHVIMDSSRNHSPAGSWIELLFHEASHHLIFAQKGYVGETISAVGRELDMPIPRRLSHVFLFYFSGKVVQQLLHEQGLRDYQLYMVRNGLFGWSHPLLERYMKSYLVTHRGLEKATRKIITEANRPGDDSKGPKKGPDTISGSGH